MKFMTIAFLGLVSISRSDDFEVVPGHFRSDNNQIDEIHFDLLQSKRFAVVRFKSRLTGKNSKARVVTDKRSNYGDSAASFAYLEIPKDESDKARALESALLNQQSLDVIYSCGEQPDDRKRKVFAYYAETNCEIEALTLKKPKEKRGLF